MSYNSEINTTMAMLISVFGNPDLANSEANVYEWHLEFPDGAKVTLCNSGHEESAGRMQTWLVSSDQESGLAQVNAKLDEGENYYEGTLHPELVVKRQT
jgi:hypothetical protein